jgi:pyruvate dehydrogenase E2 component (dihydrolipoamide acetyltransferase)
MSRVFTLPDLGEGLHEAEIVTWHVAEGDHVVADQPLLSVETDKAVVEVPSPHSGRIARLLAAPGEIVAVGAPIVEFAEGGEEPADAGAVVGELPRERVKGEAPAAPAAAGRAAPAVRRLAAELGVDLGTIEGTGPGGTITRADVERAARVVAPPARTEPVRGVRRAMARNMERSHREIVPATVCDDADIGAWGPDEDVTIRLALAIAHACRVEPALNAHYHPEREERVLFDRVDLGIATDTPDGLFVPVLRDVGNRSPEDLRRGLDNMKRDVRARSIPLEELRGQTITLSNFGMFCGRYAQLVILPPQVAILGAGRIREEVRVVDGAPAVRRVLPLSLTFDHRAVMGGEAARFLRAVIEHLGRPRAEVLR